MNISIDYDETYTTDPETWDRVIEVFKQAGHKVYCVTMRYPELHESLQVMADLNDKVDAIFFTGRKAKRPFMYDQGIHIDVWVDDRPDFCIMDAKE